MNELKSKQKLADDPVATTILETLAGLAEGDSISLMDAARAVADTRRKPTDGPELWRRYMNAVRQQATHLARQGRIEIVRKGEPVEPKNFKGVVRLRLPPLR
jgi:1,6-anhydro-N-acetylmuramate kinase